MWDRLTLVTAPVTDPVTLTEAKAHLRVDHTDEDTLIGALVDAATAMIDGPDGIGFAMVAQTWKLSLDAFPREIVLPLRPAVSVSAIRYLDVNGDQQTLASSVYRFSVSGGTGRITEDIGQAWPATACLPNAVEVEFVAGEGVPPALKAALLLIIGDLYANREAMVPGQMAPNPAVEAILGRYRSGAVAA